MILKQKSLIWKLTWPFASDNYTTIGETIYFPIGNPPNEETINHESIHIEQQKQVGMFKYLFLYLFALPIFWNPYRWKWEFEAYTKGTKISESETIKILTSSAYGWLCH